MTGRAAALAAAFCLAISACGTARSDAAKPNLLVLTSLPLLFGEGFALDAEPSPVMAQLANDHAVTAIDRTDAASLAGHDRLLMIQPRAQRPEDLVALDRWVRGGGELLLLADPRLEWPSTEPAGAVTRPPPMFADTGLLGHWGLRLDAPDTGGPATGDLGAGDLALASPGRLAATGTACRVVANGLRADCRLGKGRATVVADADWLEGGPVAGPSSEDARRTLDHLLDAR